MIDKKTKQKIKNYIYQTTKKNVLKVLHWMGAGEEFIDCIYPTIKLEDLFIDETELEINDNQSIDDEFPDIISPKKEKREAPIKQKVMQDIIKLYPSPDEDEDPFNEQITNYHQKPFKEKIMESKKHDPSNIYEFNKQLEQITDELNLNKQQKNTEFKIKTVPPVTTMIAELNETIIGQKKAKEDIAIVIREHLKHNWHHPTLHHYKEAKHIPQDIITAEITKKNIIIMGNTGTGKTLLAQTISKKYDIPMAIVDATSYTMPGYKGQEPTQMVQALYNKAGKNKELTEKGIIFIDEIDKIRFDNTGHSEDKSIKHGVQQSLLKIIEGNEINIYSENNNKEPVIINTSKILFIGCGSFFGIEDIIKKRITTKKNKIGFNKENEQFKTTKNNPHILNEITSEDLIEFGFIPEFIGRMANITYTEPITQETLEQILTEPKNSEIKQMQKTFHYDGIELKFTKEAIGRIARHAWETKLGARGLGKIVSQITREHQIQIPNTPKTITIDGNYVNKQLDKSPNQ